MNKGQLLPPVYLLLSLVLEGVLHRFAPGAVAVPEPWNLAGIVPALAGLALIVGCALMFKKRGTAIKPFDESSVLIQDGVYAISRNPIYAGMVLLSLGVAVWLGSATPFIAPVALWFILRVVFIRVEERMLTATFGEQYRAYQDKVRRWL